MNNSADLLIYCSACGKTFGAAEETREDVCPKCGYEGCLSGAFQRNEEKAMNQENTANPNKNCLEGWRCPNCGSYGPFDISVEMTVKMNDDGVEKHGDAEWLDDSPAMCNGCGFSGAARVFLEHSEYTVLLLVPDYLAENLGQETFLAFVEARDEMEAIAFAQKKAMDADFGGRFNSAWDPEDFFPLYVAEGRHADIYTIRE